jgi:hypothetical protein
MDQLIPGLAALVEAFGDCFHPQVFSTFQALIAGWVICVGPRTISEVWQATGLAAERHHDTAYAVFHSAASEWDDLGIILATLILTHLIPGGPDPRGCRLGRRRRHPLPQARGQRHLRRDLPRRRPLLEEAQDLPVRAQLGRAGHRRADPDAGRPLLLSAGPLAALPQEGPAGAQAPTAVRRRAGQACGRGQPRSDLLAGRRQRLRQPGRVAGPAEEPPGDRPDPLEGGVKRPARTGARGGQPRKAGGCRRPRG